MFDDMEGWVAWEDGEDSWADGFNTEQEAWEFCKEQGWNHPRVMHSDELRAMDE